MRGLVAGGAGGIGKAIVAGMVKAGYEVTIADISPRTEEIAAELGAVRGIVGDVGTIAGAEGAVEAASADGELHALVNTQGISPKKGGEKRPFFEIDLDEWEDVMRTNLTGPFLLMKAAYKRLAGDGSGAIVNIISITAKTGASGPRDATFPPFSPSAAHYAASKAALKNLTMSVSREMAPLAVRCNGVSPGYVGTGMGGTTSPELDAMMRPQIPLGRSATVDDVAEVVLFLLSQKSGYVTGEIIDVDGGWYPD